MTRLFEEALAGFIGIAGGIAVGSGMVAFLVVLDIIPRLIQITRSSRYIHGYEAAIVAGSLVFTFADIMEWKFSFYSLSTSFVGLFAGCFVGMLAAALTEVINVLPILAKRLGMGAYTIWLLMAMILGKVLGSLFEWFVY